METAADQQEGDSLDHLLTPVVSEAVRTDEKKTKKKKQKQRTPGVGLAAGKAILCNFETEGDSDGNEWIDGRRLAMATQAAAET